LEAVIFGLVVMLIGIIVAKVLSYYSVESYLYEWSLFITGFLLHFIYVYGTPLLNQK
jgi:hypothetical protein